MQSLPRLSSSLNYCDRVSVAGAEDRATLESDPSAAAGEYTNGQGSDVLLSLFLLVRYSESDKLALTFWMIIRPAIL